MRLASCLQEFKTLVTSYHPLVVVETFEEDRARRQVVAAARSLPHSLFEWSLSNGLYFASDAGNGNRIGTTSEPVDVLRHMLSLDRVGICFSRTSRCTSTIRRSRD
jgi:hypothetical protein